MTIKVEEKLKKFKEEMTYHMEKVAYLIAQFKINKNQNGRKTLLVEEVTMLEVAILVTLGIIMVENGRKVFV